jgi:radical SAM protein with 4Fe4S-binding SPASM domain
MKTIREGKGKDIPLMDCFDLIPFMEVPKTPEDREILDDLVGCQACRCVMGIGVNGDVYPCEFVSKTVLGNLDNTHFMDIYNGTMAAKIRDRTERHGACSSCHHLDMCGAGCILFQESMDSDILGSWPYCWHPEESQP